MDECYAMKEDANITWTVLKKIKKHLIRAGCDILQPEKTMREHHCSFLAPVCMYYYDKENKARRHLAWYIPVDRQILFWLNKMANHKEYELVRVKEWKEFHFLFSGDHGQ